MTTATGKNKRKMAENLAILESQLLWELRKCSSKPDIKMSLWSFPSLSPPPSNMHLSDDSPFLIKSEPSFPKQQDTGVGIRAACLVLFSNFVKTGFDSSLCILAKK